MLRAAILEMIASTDVEYVCRLLSMKGISQTSWALWEAQQA